MTAVSTQKGTSHAPAPAITGKNRKNKFKGNRPHSQANSPTTQPDSFTSRADYDRAVSGAVSGNGKVAQTESERAALRRAANGQGSDPLPGPSTQEQIEEARAAAATPGSEQPSVAAMPEIGVAHTDDAPIAEKEPAVDPEPIDDKGGEPIGDVDASGGNGAAKPPAEADPEPEPAKEPAKPLEQPGNVPQPATGEIIEQPARAAESAFERALRDTIPETFGDTGTAKLHVVEAQEIALDLARALGTLWYRSTQLTELEGRIKSMQEHTGQRITYLESELKKAGAKCEHKYDNKDMASALRVMSNAAETLHDIFNGAVTDGLKDGEDCATLTTREVRKLRGLGAGFLGVIKLIEDKGAIVNFDPPIAADKAASVA